jgi:fucose 4-O-acetylase-like acetyltransferase
MPAIGASTTLGQMFKPPIFIARYILSRQASRLQETTTVNKQRQQQLWEGFWLWNMSVLWFYGLRVFTDLLKRRPAFSIENTIGALISGTIVAVLIGSVQWWNGRKNQQ